MLGHLWMQVVAQVLVFACGRQSLLFCDANEGMQRTLCNNLSKQWELNLSRPDMFLVILFYIAQTCKPYLE